VLKNSKTQNLNKSIIEGKYGCDSAYSESPYVIVKGPNSHNIK